MSRNHGEDGWVPSPELLAAHADGELTSEGRAAALGRRVEAWLQEHPQAARAVEAQRLVTEWCQATAPADPGERAWAPLAARLQALPLVPTKASRWPRRLGIAALGTTAAACLWLALTLLSDLGRQQADRPRGPEARPQAGASPGGEPLEVFPVATAAEVEILSVQGEDTATVVVGALPVEGTLQLLRRDEMTLTSVAPARDNMVPEVRTGPGAPMIWAPLDAEREDPEDPNQT